MSNQFTDAYEYLTRRPPLKKTRLGRFFQFNWIGGANMFGDLIRALIMIFLIGILIGGCGIRVYDWTKTHRFNVIITEHK